MGRSKGEEEVGEREGRGGKRKRGWRWRGEKGGNGSGPVRVLEEIDAPVSLASLYSSRSVLSLVITSVISRYCDRACLLVRWLVGLFVCCDRCDFTKSKGPIFIKFGTDVQHSRQTSLLTFQMSGSKFKVKTSVLKSYIVSCIDCALWGSPTPDK